MCHHLSARIIIRDTHTLGQKLVSQFPQKMRASSLSPMEPTCAKTTSIFLLKKMALGAIQSKSVQDILIFMNVLRGKLVTTTIMKHRKETSA